MYILTVFPSCLLSYTCSTKNTVMVEESYSLYQNQGTKFIIRSRFYPPISFPFLCCYRSWILTPFSHLFAWYFLIDLLAMLESFTLRKNLAGVSLLRRLNVFVLKKWPHVVHHLLIFILAYPLAVVCAMICATCVLCI